MGENVAPLLTPEQYRLAIRLEEVFMPEARRQRIKANFGENSADEGTRFVHYTSAEAALKIIKGKRLWMRNTTCMADYSEVQHGVALLRNAFADQARRSAFVGALDACHDGVAVEAANLFDQVTNDILLNTYVASFSEHDDAEDLQGRLSMWRAFGGSTARVGMVIRIPKLTPAPIALNLLFSPVAYLTEPQVYGVMSEVVENVKRSRDFLRSLDRSVVKNTVFLMFQAAGACLKHEGFREEREWRAVYSPTLRPSPLMELSTEIVGGVPQPVYKIPLDASVSEHLGEIDLSRMLDRIVIGPTAYPWAIAQAFVGALREAHVGNPETRVFASNIPIRS